MATLQTNDEDLQELIRRTSKATLARRIKQARQEAGYTHDYLGQLCGGMYRQSLIALEQGRWRPRPATLRLIAQHTSRDLDWFLDLEVDPKSGPFQDGQPDGTA